MTYRRMKIDFFVILFIFSLQHTPTNAKRDFQKIILNYDSMTPLIAILYKDNVKPIKADPGDVIAPDVNSVEPPKDQKLYNLYTILRTTQETEDIDADAAEVFDKTENILREALRARCNKLDNCVKKCPPKKKYTCTLTCKEVYDDYDVCEKPKKKNQCKKPKCGKTMPPSWLL